MESYFEYRRIGPDFRAELLDLLERQESVVLLGPRNSGKLFVLREVEKSLPPETIHVRVEFPNTPPIVDADGLRAVLHTRIQKSFSEAFVTADERSLLGELGALCSSTRRHVVFMASNVDSLAHHLAQQFLREIRVLCQRDGGRLTALLTGEENLRDLVWGEDSEFNTAHQFVVQGYDQNEFVNYMKRRHEVAELRFRDEDQCLVGLFKVTGGSPYLARATLWAWMESQARVSRPGTAVEAGEVGTEEFLEFINRPLISQFESMSVLDRSDVVISHDPHAWRDLDCLIRGYPVTVDSPNSEPTGLELAGFAVRDGSQLRFVSPMTEQMAKSRYGATQFGDLYAIHGDWKTAIAFYQRIPEQSRIRPNGSDDRIQLSHVLKALGGKLNSLATGRGHRNSQPTDQERLEQVKRLFVDGCKLLLGASEVTFWSDRREAFPLVAGSSKTDWHVEEPQQVSDKVTNFGRQVLNTLGSTELGWQDLKKPAPKLAQQGAIALLPTIRSGYHSAVIVSNIRRDVSFSRDRYALLKELMEQFTNAYDHLIANMAISDRLAVRKEQLSVATGIIAGLGQKVRNPREALKAAAEELRKLGFRRIMFALVDPARHRIRGVSQAIGEPCRADIAIESDYELGQRPYRDIQPWVVDTNRHVVVDDWRTWNQRQHEFPPVNTRLCDQAAMKSFAVVPMRIRKALPNKEFVDEVFGTIHFELETGLTPTQDDIDDMLEFGRQMAAAVNQSERVNVLLETLNSDGDSTIIVDRDRNIRFVNTAAGVRFGLHTGWSDAHEGLRIAKDVDVGLNDDVDFVIDHGIERLRHLSADLTTSARSESRQILPLYDWRFPENGQPNRPTLGAVVTIRDLTPLHRLFNALLTIAQHAKDSDNTAEALLNAMSDFGYTKVRLYRIDSQDHNVMAGYRASGLPKEFEEPFYRGMNRSNRNEANQWCAWWCIDNAEPRVFIWDPNRKDEEPQLTKHGLTICSVSNPGFKVAWKNPGDVWIDLPLIAADHQVIGKLSIDCGKNYECDLRPEDFELLKLFSSLLGALLDAHDRRREGWLREAAEKAIRTVAHAIKTKLAGLGGFARKYEQAAPGNLQVLKWNAIHQLAVDGSMAAVDRVMQIFGRDVKLIRKRMTLKPFLNEVLKTHLAAMDCNSQPEHAKLVCPDDLEASFDPDCLRMVFEELLSNSRQMTDRLEDLHVEISAESLMRGNVPWLRVIVRDNGPGIPVSHREQVFDPFFSHRPNGKPGTGLGLNCVRRVILAHDGQVVIHSEPNWGAVFVIEIPKEKPQ